MTKSELKKEIKKAGSIEKLTAKMIKIAAIEIKKMFNCSDEKAFEIAKPMVMSELASIVGI